MGGKRHFYIATSDEAVHQDLCSENSLIRAFPFEEGGEDYNPQRDLAWSAVASHLAGWGRFRRTLLEEMKTFPPGLKRVNALSVRVALWGEG